MLRALGNPGWRIIGQPIVPAMKSSLATADGIILIPPRVVLVCDLAQRRRRRARTLLFESIGIDGWSRVRDEAFVGDVWVTLRRRLRHGIALSNSEQNKSGTKKIDRSHRAESIAQRTHVKAEHRAVPCVPSGDVLR